MEKKKLTVVEKFEDTIAFLRGETPPNGSTVEEIIVFQNERMAQTIKKNASGSNSERKPTAKQLENAVLKEQIVAIISSAAEPMTSTDIGKAVGESSNYRISALLGQLVRVTASGKENPNAPLVRTEVKGKAYFSLAEQE